MPCVNMSSIHEFTQDVLSPTFNGHSALQCFKCCNVIKNTQWNNFDFYLRLPHICAITLLHNQVPKKENTSKANHGEGQQPADIQSSTVSSSVQSTLGKVENYTKNILLCMLPRKISFYFQT